jgi:amidase
MDDVAFRPAVALAKALRAGELGSRELLEHYVARVERLNSRVNAIVTLDLERARRRADAADAARARGELWGPLHGLPMTIKDSFETAGLRSTCGVPELAEHVPARDATAVGRIAAAGAVVFGKTNAPTWAMDVQTYNPVFGTTNNPWDTARSPGGSSGGAAAAIAAGLTGLELGSDIGGSIRNPAHFCGVYGHKSSFGIVPGRGHLPPAPGTLADTDIGVFGPLGRSADDLALLLEVIAGPEEDQAVGWRLALPPPRRGALADYRVAAWLDDPACPVDDAVRGRLEATVEALAGAGVRVDTRVRPVDFAEAYRDYLQLLLPVTMAGAPESTIAALAEHARQLDPDDDGLQARLSRFATQRHRDWLVADERRQRHRAAWAALFRDYDVLLCPVTPSTAITHDHEGDVFSRTIQVNGKTRLYADQVAWAGVIGMVFLPATVAPVGRTSAGLPVGVQIVGPYLEDRTPLDFARRLGDVIGGFEPPPGW